MLARSNAAPAKIPRSHVIKRACPSACATTASIFFRIGGVVLIEFASGQKRKSPGSEISGRDVVAWCVGALLDRRNFAIATCVKCAVAAVQRNIAANSRAFDPGYIAQSIKSLFNETLTRRRVGILRNGQCDRAGPETLRAESNVLLGEANKTRDEQGRACQKRDRQRDLCADENFTEPLLPRAAGSTATALFQCVT